MTSLKYLLSRGANPLAQDKWGKNALLQLLEAHDSFTEHRGAPLINRSLKYIATNFPQLVNQPDNMGTYPLHAALQRMRRYEGRQYGWHQFSAIDTAAPCLLDAGADPRTYDVWGNTALHHLAVGLAKSVEQMGSGSCFVGSLIWA
jgi:hypothetical protein